MRFRHSIVWGWFFFSPVVWAGDIDQLQSLGQSQFKAISEDLGGALSYKAIAPAEPLGLTGFDLGVELTATKLEHSNFFASASSSGDFPATLILPKLHLHKGLPWDIDVGVSYSKAPSTNISLLGAEIRYALISGGVALPAVAVRGTYSKLSGVDQLDFNTKGLEITLSKGFAMITPYAGVGRIWIDSTPDASTGLSSESPNMNRWYLGGNFNLAVLNLAVEYDRTGDANSYSLKLGWRF